MQLSRKETTCARFAAGAAALTAAVVLGGCARIEAPPGGPPDAAPPQLLATYPDSMAVLPAFDGEVEFRFDETVSEGSSPNIGAGTGDLERLIILSPSANVPEVAWRRNRISVRPREGWQPGLVYRVELLPGVADLRQNRFSGPSTIVTFTTGAPAPSAFLSGRVVDWATGRSAASALVEAVLLRDSLVYRGTADSGGAFRIGPLPSGAYEVHGVIDANRNRRRDSREAHATASLPVDSTSAGTLYAFVHDTIPPRGRAAAVIDSVRASVTATQPLLPGQTIPTARVRVLLLPDSTPVAVVAAGLRTADAARAPDTTRAADTTRAVDTTAAPQQRAALTDQVFVEVAGPWTPGARYVIVVDSVRNVTGVAGEIRSVLDVPAAPEPAAADSLPRTPGDTAAPAPVPADTSARPLPER